MLMLQKVTELGQIMDGWEVICAAFAVGDATEACVCDVGDVGDVGGGGAQGLQEYAMNEWVDTILMEQRDGME